MHRPVVWYPYNQKEATYEPSQNCPTRHTLTQHNSMPASNPLDGGTNNFSGLPGASLQNPTKNLQTSNNVQVNSNFQFGSTASEPSIQNTNRPPIASERRPTSDSLSARQAFSKRSSKFNASTKPVHSESTSHYPNGLYYMTVPVTASNKNITGGNSGPLTSSHVEQQNYFSNNISSLVNYNANNPPTLPVTSETGSSKAIMKHSPKTLPWKVKGYWIQNSDIGTHLQDQTPSKSPASPDLGKTPANCTFLEYKKKFMEKENKVHVA